MNVSFVRFGYGSYQPVGARDRDKPDDWRDKARIRVDAGGQIIISGFKYNLTGYYNKTHFFKRREPLKPGTYYVTGAEQEALNAVSPRKACDVTQRVKAVVKRILTTPPQAN